MAFLSVADLLTPLTGDQVRATWVKVLVKIGIPADGWRKGGTFSSILTVAANLFASWTVILCNAIGGGFLETATGDWLTRLALYVFNVSRPLATFATGAVTLTNSGGGIFSYAAGAAQFINAITGAAYTNSAPFTSNPGTTITVPVSAVVIGTGSNASPGEVTTLGTAMGGVAVTNLLAIVGSDEMQDEDLRSLCLARIGALSNSGRSSAYDFAVRSALNVPLSGTASVTNGSTAVSFSSPQTLAAGALLQFLSQPGVNYTLQAAISGATAAVLEDAYFGVTSPATSASSGLPVNVNRVDVSEFSSTGQVTVYCASPSGAPSAGDVAAATANVLALARPDAVTVAVNPASTVPVSRTLTLYSTGAGGVTAAQLQTAAQTALTDAIAKYPIGGLTVPPSMNGYLYAEYVRAIAGSVDPSIYFVDDGGAADVQLLAGQVATMAVTAVAVIVSAP